MKLSKLEREVLWWFYCGDSMRSRGITSEGITSEKLYIICGNGIVYAVDITEGTVLSLVNSGAILPVGLSVKEWKVQVALGVAENTKFILTEFGARVGTSHTSWDAITRADQIEDRMGIEKY